MEEMRTTVPISLYTQLVSKAESADRLFVALKRLCDLSDEDQNEPVDFSYAWEEAFKAVKMAQPTRDTDK
jgi:hypothetical protein